MPPSSPTHRKPSTSILERKVDDLIHKYSKVQEPRPILRDVLRRPDRSSLLIDALSRQVSLIRCRSQAFDDGQITVYDRALLVLSKDGKELGDTGALELYLTEFLGLVPICGKENAEDAIGKLVELQGVLNKVSEVYNMPGTTTSSDNRYTREPPSPRKCHDYDPHERESKRCSKTTTNNDNHHFHDRLERMLDLYYRAKNDYYRTKRSEGVESLSAIRFLRDTTENTILYLGTNKLSDHELIPELEDTFLWSRDKAAELSGGRKRHFDDGLGRGRRDSRRDSGRELREKKRVIDSYRP